MFWIVSLYLIVSIIPAVVNLFNDVALGLSILFGSLLAVFAGGGLRGSLYGNKWQKIGGFVAAVIFMTIAYWLSSKFDFSIKDFSFTGLEWIIIGFFIGLLFVSKTVALGEKSKNPMREISAYFWFSLVFASALWIFEGWQQSWFFIIPLFTLSIYLYSQYKSLVFTAIALGKENIKLGLITPQETISRLVRLGLSNQEFSQIHHLMGAEGKYETIDSHVDYLDGIQKYQNKESNNYIVGLRLAYLEELKKCDFNMKAAIEKCKIKYPFNEAP